MIDILKIAAGVPLIAVPETPLHRMVHDAAAVVKPTLLNIPVLPLPLFSLLLPLKG